MYLLQLTSEKGQPVDRPHYLVRRNPRADGFDRWQVIDDASRATTWATRDGAEVARERYSSPTYEFTVVSDAPVVRHAPHSPMTTATVEYLRALHPDPFTQAAIFRTWKNARGLLREDVAWSITRTQDPSAAQSGAGQ